MSKRGLTLTADKPQYSRLMSTSMGVLAIDNAFLTVKSVRDDVTSARKPKVKVKVDSVRPMMVRNWRCHPKASFLRDVLARVEESGTLYS